MITSLEKGYKPQDVVGDIIAEHGNGVAFQDSIQLNDTIQRCTDFYEGRQWGNVTGKTRALPRATFNMTEMIVNNKVAGILAQPLKVVFQSSEMPELAKKLTDFHESIEKEMAIDGLYEECVNRAAIEGCAFVHFYWDAEAVGIRGEFKGGMRGEMIEARAVTVQNPLCENIQLQKWVIIETRAECSAVRAMCEDKSQRELIKPDDSDLTNGTLIQEQQGSGMVTVYTRYFRKDNEVYFEKATKGAGEQRDTCRARSGANDGRYDTRRGSANTQYYRTAKSVKMPKEQQCPTRNREQRKQMSRPQRRPKPPQHPLRLRKM